MRFVAVARVDEIPAGKSIGVRVDGTAIAVFNVEGTFYALYNICPHEGGPLGQGHVKGFVVTCPWHDLAFDIRTGRGTDSGGQCVGSYELRINGEDIYVGPRRRV